MCARACACVRVRAREWTESKEEDEDEEKEAEAEAEAEEEEGGYARDGFDRLKGVEPAAVREVCACVSACISARCARDSGVFGELACERKRSFADGESNPEPWK